MTNDPTVTNIDVNAHDSPNVFSLKKLCIFFELKQCNVLNGFNRLLDLYFSNEYCGVQDDLSFLPKDIFHLALKIIRISVAISRYKKIQ